MGHIQRLESFQAVKYKLLALKVVIQAEEAKFKLLTEGHSIMTVKTMEERLDSIERSFQENNR